MTGILSRAKPIEETTEFIKLLLYGPAGVGKTFFAGHAPNPVCLDFERSSETYRHVDSLKHIPVFSPISFAEVLDFCNETIKQRAFDTIIFDTVSRFQTDQVNEYLVKETANGTKRSKYLALWGDYRVSTNMMDELFSMLQKAPIHVILISHSLEEVDQESKQINRIRPDLTPALSKAVVGLVNVVAYLDTTTSIKGELDRKLIVNPLNKIVAKNRLNIQALSIKNPTFKEVFKTK